MNAEQTEKQAPIPTRRQLVDHQFGPFYRADSRILILGSFPSVKSREASFYYAHPQNRFWKVLAFAAQCEPPQTLEEKKAFLSRQRIALWDVIERCEIVGSSDASIRHAMPSDLTGLLAKTDIQAVYLNGKTAEKLFRRWHPDFSLPLTALPSTSPANAAWSLPQLCEVWQAALKPFLESETIVFNVGRYKTL